MYVLCGLGNPGKKYELTKHNVGFRIVDFINSNFKLKVFKQNKEYIIHKGKIESKQCYTFKSFNYMNLSGPPLKNFISYYKINIDNIIIIHDDLDLKIGKIKYKKGGGDGGHRGLQSLDSAIGKNYRRLRVGIGRPLIKSNVDKYVLEKFNKNEEEIFQNQIKLIVKNINCLLEKKSDLFLTKIAQENNIN
tara:strand:- start:3742 stop:4314 length:573 start_codon:yes stop_codon:yes gene_type:complete